jgi:large conductance mechanosensitive channel
LAGFKEFLLKTNALALAVGVIIGAALGSVVTSLVDDVIMPPIGWALGGVDFSSLQIVIGKARDGTDVAIRWGLLVNSIITFVVIAFIVYGISKVFLKPDPAAGPSEEVVLLREIRDALNSR